MSRKPKKTQQEPLKPGVVYVKQAGDAWNVLWLDGERIRSIRRRGKRQAEEWAARKQRELDGGGVSDLEIPFGDTAEGLDGSAGNSWTEILWQGALAVAMNPGSGTDALQKAVRTVSQAANAARKFLAPQAIGEDDMDEHQWADQVVEEAGPDLTKLVLERLADRKGASESDRRVILSLVEGGKDA